jgi:hypothetical protein
MEKPSRELTEEEQELVAVLRQRFFLLPRDYWKTILGGVLAFFLSTGVISWSAAKAAIETSVAKKATDDIVAFRTTAEQHVTALNLGSYISAGDVVRLRTDTTPISRSLHAFGQQPFDVRVQDTRESVYPPQRWILEHGRAYILRSDGSSNTRLANDRRPNQSKMQLTAGRSDVLPIKT